MENRQSGRGYSAVSVVDDNVYTMGSRDGNCYAICLSAATVRSEMGNRSFRAPALGDNYNTDWGAGPRSTPTVDGDQVFVLSDIGVLAASIASSGNRHLVQAIWSMT